MFALLIPTRPLLSAPTATLSPTQCSFTIPSTPPFTHLALFLHPGQTLPPDTLAAIYIQLPPSANFKLLGAISNYKQSAMFKVNAGRAAGSDVREGVMVDESLDAHAPGSGGGDVVVGISIEPATQVRAQLESNAATRISAPSTNDALTQPQSGAELSGDLVKKLAQRTGQNAFNFLTGFAETANGREVFPMKAFQDWWSKFEKKVQLDPGFLLREGDG